MDEKDLLIFLTLADTGNLTRTAEKLYLSQPTLSKRLQNMEADLGAALFLRSKQGVTLTPAGEAAREVIQRTARELNTLREQLQIRKDTICGTLRIEVSIDYSKYRLPQVLAAYTAQYPDVTLRVSTNHSRDCLRDAAGQQRPPRHRAGRIRLGRGQDPVRAGAGLPHPQPGECQRAPARAAVHRPGL